MQQTHVDFYNEYWANLKPFTGYKIRRIAKILEYLGEAVKTTPQARILDLGCGDGRCVAIWNEIGRADGLDLSDFAVDRAAQRYPFLHFYCGDATATALPAGVYDIIVSQEVLEHIEIQEQYINECVRLLKPGGFLVLTTPNKYYFDRRKGGNYSTQPVENLVNAATLRQLLHMDFTLKKMESILFGQADYGIYRFFSNKVVSYGFRVLGLSTLKTYLMNRLLLGVHLTVLAQKK